MEKRIFWCLGIFLLVGLLILPNNLIASKGAASKSQGNWWRVTPEDENPSSHYDSILYSEIAPKLREIEKNSNRVKVEVIGQSAGGRDLFLVTLSDPQAMGRLGQYQAIRNTMLKDPEKAQEMIEKFGDFKVPIFINGSIHGDEFPGVDAALRLIEALAYGNSEEVKTILENVILLVNVVQNPDGRVMNTRRNANGFDINRDFIAQTQPETLATVKIITEWNPMVTLDLHGFVNPMLIEPCTPPHNPNYEYDLYIKWAYDQALAMEAELTAQTDETEAIIPYRDWDLGWDDWPPSYVPMYGMYHGSYGHTLETPHRDSRGVDAHFAAVWGALKFVAENRQAMVHDQIEIFRRGFLGLLQQPIPPELLPTYPQYQDLIIQDFPAAYIIPTDAPFQMSQHQPARLVDFLIFNDIEVEKVSEQFTMNGVSYPKGTYIVWMDQPKRGLANTILEDGLDLSGIDGLYFYSPPSVWSHPRLWGAELAVMNEKLEIQTAKITKAGAVKGSAEIGAGSAYVYLPTSISAFKATNDLLSQGKTLYRASEPFIDGDRTFSAGAIIVADGPDLANELANQYGLSVSNIESIPETAIRMKKQRVAVYGDEGVSHCLKVLGFNFDEVSTSDLNAGVISQYDVFLNQSLRWSNLDAEGQTSLADWFAAGGDYVGLAYRGRGPQFAIDAGLAGITYEYDSANAIVKIDFDSEDAISAGFRETDYAFVYYPVWFSDLGSMKVTAWYSSVDFLVSGFWPEWQTKGAAGQPVIIHGSNAPDDLQDTVLIGIDPTFRGHPENMFRIVGNAIYTGLD